MDIPKYILAGKSTFTIAFDNKRYTYRVDHPKNKPAFVKLLTGSFNESDYTFIGTIFNELDWRPKTRIPGALMFGDFWREMNSFEFIPSGYCARCGKLLTTPESVEANYGPECIKFIR